MLHLEWAAPRNFPVRWQWSRTFTCFSSSIMNCSWQIQHLDELLYWFNSSLVNLSMRLWNPCDWTKSYNLSPSRMNCFATLLLFALAMRNPRYGWVNWGSNVQIILYPYPQGICWETFLIDWRFSQTLPVVSSCSTSISKASKSATM